MTDWEVGQDLVYLADEISERMGDIKESHPKVYWMLDDILRTIGDTFNREPFVTSHGFGLRSHDECGDTPAPSECICGEINARHCPIHQEQTK